MKVVLPDGTQQDFPDGTPSADIEAAIAAQFAQSDTSANPPTPPSVAAASPQLTQGTPQLTGLARYGKMGAEAIGEGLTHIAGLPGDLMSGLDKLAPPGSGIRTALQGINPLFGMPLAKSGQIEDVLAKHGMAKSADVTPGWGNYPEAERLGYAGVRGATEGLALPMGSGAVVNGLTGAASAIAGQGEEDLMGLGPSAAGVAGMLPGLVGGKASDLVMARDAISQAEAPLAHAASQAGVNVADLTPQHLAQIRDDAISSAKENLTAASAAHDAQRTAIAGTLHPTATDPESAGQVLQSNALQWYQQGLPAAHAAAWAPLDAGVGGDTAVPRDAFAGALQNVTASRGSNAGLSQRLVGNAGADLRNNFFGTPAEQAAMAAGDTDGRTPTFYLPQTWQDARRFRSDIGENVNPQLSHELGKQSIDQLYAAHTADMRSALQDLPNGDQLTQQFDQANATSRGLYDFVDGPMSKVLQTGDRSLTNPAPGQAATALLNRGKTDGRDLAAFRQVMPEGVDALAASAVNNGKWTAMSDGAKAALVPNPWMRQHIDDLEQNAVDQVSDLKSQQTQARVDFNQQSRALQSYKDMTKDKGDTEKDVLAALIGGGVGATAPWVKDQLTGGHHSQLDSGFYGGLGEAMGAFAPRLYRGTSSMLRNPLYPAAGYGIGSEAEQWPEKPKGP